jgi:phosphorylcholine metabolism protein LicD
MAKVLENLTKKMVIIRRPAHIVLRRSTTASRITRRNTTVTVQIRETNNNHVKQGLFLDYVQLKLYPKHSIEQAPESKPGIIGSIINAASRFIFGQ